MSLGAFSTALSHELYERALEVLPGGVNSPVRAFRSVGGNPYFVERGEGAYVWDVEGTRYLDYVQSYGASILGHAHPKVVEAIRAAAGEGTSFGAPTEREILLLRFVANKTQTEIAARIGVSQMQVSRLVARGLKRLRETLSAPDPGDPAQPAPEA